MWCQVGLIFICKELVESGQEPSGLDQKTSAYLQNLARQGFWRCEEGEELLLAGEERIRAQKLLLIGLGSCDNVNSPRLADQVRTSARVLACIGANDIGVRMPPFWGRDAYAELLTDTCLTLVREWGGIERKGAAIGSELKLVYAVDPTFLEEAEEAATRLRKALSKEQALRSSIIVEGVESPGIQAQEG